MADPFRLELTSAYFETETLDWARRERLARVVRPSRPLRGQVALLASWATRAFLSERRPELPRLGERGHPA